MAKGSSLHVDIAKSVALIEMFRSGAALAADIDTIVCSVKSVSRDAVKQALDELVAWKILIERKHLDAYGVLLEVTLTLKVQSTLRVLKYRRLTAN